MNLSHHPRNVAVLGSTGSIGQNTLDVVRFLPEQFRVAGLAANQSWEKLAVQASEFSPNWVFLADSTHHQQLKQALPSGIKLLLSETELLAELALTTVDTVVSAMVGAAGLRSTLAAAEAGKRVCLANKESLVVAGHLVMGAAQRHDAEILPVDSEHSAIFQALHQQRGLKRIIITGSGGPFRGHSSEQLAKVTVAEALNHPTWKMGRKITIDSATLMNKALEIIEAHWLFDLQADQIELVIHPESIVHSFVEFLDGSVLAQLSPPDMRLPIQYALCYPKRCVGPARTMNWKEMFQLRFEKPDTTTFPAIELGYEVCRKKGSSGTVLNAANEVAVERFLRQEISYLDIALLCGHVLHAHDYIPNPTLEEILALDQWARLEATRWINRKITISQP
ncbi:MAG: 1-deoxy-D-xylulose-5-phosphate reductoisomerase [Zavarzinella sp.]